MPRFFFDLYDEASRSSDEHGENFESAVEAGDQAIAILLDTLREASPTLSDQRQHHGCRVRNAEGVVVYDVSLDFKVSTLGSDRVA